LGPIRFNVKICKGVVRELYARLQPLRNYSKELHGKNTAHNYNFGVESNSKLEEQKKI